MTDRPAGGEEESELTLISQSRRWRQNASAGLWPSSGAMQKPLAEGKASPGYMTSVSATGRPRKGRFRSFHIKR